MLCSLASTVLILVIIAVILDVYIIFRYEVVKNNNLILAVTFIIILFAMIVVWVSNKLCYNYNWILYVIITGVVIYIIDSITILFDPLKRGNVIAEIRMEEESLMKYRI